MKNRLLLFLVLFATVSNAQQLPQFSQYFQNDLLLNPAVAGTKQYVPVALTHRMQWTSFKEAPTSQLFSIHGPVNNKMGLGLLLTNHEAGPTHLVSAQFAYSYQLKINDSTKLSFGVAPMIMQYSLQKDKIMLDEKNDNTFNRISGKTLVADVNAGIYLYGKNYSLGFAAPQLMENKLRMGDELFKERLQRHYLAFAAYNHKLNEMYSLTPSVLFKTVKSASPPSQLDATMKVSYKQFLWAGASFRWDVSKKMSNACVAFLGVSKLNFSFGYSFDYNLGLVNQFGTGSHELFLSYNITRKKKE
ncbi:MAG TPA: type IX secretion system membrane protein PorP/SprF [Bacteroidia bacterium]|jgi:type IX secretion system PorP/SprF family membrane protein|nr:type IX secretion system membrane protein PorP/SprF [Bacteroidia bacterium]HRG53158.1 type IX secretion system membrane protein PorP/SprF [Bacteroidia bacterium]